MTRLLARTVLFAYVSVLFTGGLFGLSVSRAWRAVTHRRPGRGGP